MASYLGRYEEEEEELGQDGIEDMINLMSLTEHNLMKNIRLRYDKELIYTYTGSILVAVNPYKMFNIYGLDMVRKYEDQILGAHPPHLFAIGSASFGKMNKDTENQVIIISGESGAGKTESTKLLMQYLAAVNKSGTNIVTERILEANPLLESFGNAKTIKNDNSSRFGKYVELYFKGGSIVGAKTSEYLLEKSRIVTQAADERNYHVFYELLAGLDEEEKASYGLSDPENYFYLNQGGSCQIASKNDVKDYKDLKAAIEVLGFKQQEKDTIYKILASVLHLGNIFFTSVQGEADTAAIGSESSDLEIKWVCHLLQLDEDWLKEALTKKITEARQERMVTPLSSIQAQEARDAIAKALYSRLFMWLVERVNQIVKGPESKDPQRDKVISIAILDIFGFEDFRTNSFEQLCINYANESLQFYFNKHIFKLEQNEYTRERIQWTNISFHDNQPTIDLISKKPLGIIHILDDESNFPKGTDQSFLEKCHHSLSTNSLYEKPRMSGPEFAVKHYAGKVTYNVRNFLDKNRDTLRADVVQLLIQSKNNLISKMFRELRDRVITKTISKMSGLYVTMKPKTPTVAAGFHESLLSLIENMAKCNPWFVRCIKPNNHKAAMLFEKEVVLQQLRYTGMLETIKIRKMGYPFRHRFQQFAEKYFVILPHRQRSQSVQDDRVTCERVLRSLGSHWDQSWQLGISKVFLKEHLSYDLDHKKALVVNDAVLKLQKYSRGFIARTRYQKSRDASILIQAAFRRWRERARYLALRRGIVRAQAQYRMHLQRKRYTGMLSEHRRQQEEDLRRLREEKRVEEARLVRDRKRIFENQQQPSDVSKRISALESGSKNGVKRSRTEMPGIQTVANLEIPRDLANVFRRIEGHHPIHSEENNITKTRTVKPVNLNLAIPPDIDAYAFSKYANIYFKDHSWRMKKEPITKPFLKESDTREAVALFKLVMRYMHDSTQTKRQQRAVADYIVQKGLNNPQLRDEIYAQLCTQTWLNTDDNSRARGWVLMTSCLSCFPPSNKLSKYLLKYVSDHGYGEYKETCQLKLLQSLSLDRDEKRTYPPCLLEWKAAEEAACMALQGVFSDRETRMAHVESWTTSEEFASYLLQTRGVKEGHHGWTMLLREDNEAYEYAGYDYMLDHVSEMELEPGFPHSRSYFITGMEKNRDGSSVRRDLGGHHPHNAEEAWLLALSDLGVSELLKPAPTDPRPGPDPQAFFKYNSLSSSVGLESPYTSRENLLSPSKLNQRIVDENLSPTSYLNIRYISGNKKRVAPAPPGSENSESTLTPTSPRAMSPAPIQNGHASPNGELPIANSKLNRRAVKPIDKKDLSDSRLNDRYSGSPLVNGLPNGNVLNGHIPNGNLVNGDVKDNRRYSKHPQGPSTSAGNPTNRSAHDVIQRNRKSSEGPQQYPHSDTSEAPSMKSDGMDRWVDNIFDPVLLGNVDDLSDVRALENRIKGGGDLGQPQYHATLLSSGYGGQTSGLNLTSPPVQPAGTVFNTNIPLAPGASYGAGVISPTAQFVPNIPQTPVLSPATVGQVPMMSVTMQPPPDPMQQLLNQQQASQQQAAQQQATQQAAQQQASQQLAAQQLVAQQQVAQQQAAQQFAAQQFAAQQAAAQEAIKQQTAAQTQQQAVKQQLQQQQKESQELQKHTAQLQMQLQTQQLQTQILQQSLQGEILKRQLKELQDTEQDEVFTTSPTDTEPKSRFSSSTLSPQVSPRDPGPRFHKKPAPEPKAPAQGEIDKSRPGGVQTLKRAYEHKLYPAVVNDQYTTPYSDDGRSPTGSVRSNKEVKFADDVQTIPTPEYKNMGTSPFTTREPPTPTTPDAPLTPSPHPDSHTSPTAPLPPAPPSVVPPTPPAATPAPPPPPLVLPKPPNAQDPVKSDKTTPTTPESVLQTPARPAADEADRGSVDVYTPPPAPPLPPPPVKERPLGKDKFMDGKGTIRVIRIGKIQWPPPVDEVEKPKVTVGRLVIQENQREEMEGITGKPVDIHRKISERIKQARQDSEIEEQVPRTGKKWEPKKLPPAEPLPVQPPPPPRETDINMKERQKILERQLTGIFLKNKEEKEEVPPPPKPLPEPEVLPPPPPPQKIEPPVTKPQPEPIKPVSAPVEPPVEVEEPEPVVDVQALEQVKTRLFPQRTGPFYMYNKVPWCLEVRKELFTPNEKSEALDPLLANLVFIQVVQDVHAASCIRIMKEDRIKARNLLESYSITPRNAITEPSQRSEVKRKVIELAFEWPCYFSRIFAATGGNRLSRLNYVAVSHSGVYLLSRERDLIEDRVKVLEKYRFENIINVSVPQPYTVQLHVSSYRHVFLYTHKANQLRSLIDAFCIECEQTEMYVRATKSYPTRELTLLNFEKGDIIKLTNRNMTIDRGWLYGSVHGRAGYFPKEYIVSMPKYEVENVRTTDRAPVGQISPAQRQPSRKTTKKVLSPNQVHMPEITEDEETHLVNGVDDDDSRSVSSTNSIMLPPEGGTYTMLEFAMKYFRKSPYRYVMARGAGGSIHGTFKEISSMKVRTLERQARRKRGAGEGEDWTWKEQVEMIKWTRSPIQISLLEHKNAEVNRLALECFINIMRYMGDYPMAKDQRQVDCVLYILMQCHNNKAIIDEVYCQLIKQTTNNRSTKSDSETMGWRLLSILTSFFDVTEYLQPYLQKYMETVAYDGNRPQQALAALCLENIRKTTKFGGRKNVPSKMEVDAITRGRISKRQVCILPGGAPVVLNVKSSNVVLDVIDQICHNFGITDTLEREEYTAFYVIEKENQYCPLSRGEYIFDITTELINQRKEFYILFQRTSWMFPLSLDPRNKMYLDVMYHQCIPDYLDGFMLPVPAKTLPAHIMDEIAYLGALQLRVMGKKGTPVQKEVASVVPKNVQDLPDLKLPKWTNQIYHRLFEVYDVQPEEAKFKFLEKLMRWPLFGSTFFNIKSVTDPRVPGEARLAINKNGVSFLHPKTQVTLSNYPLQQIISTRRVTTEKNIRLLDVKIGDLMNQKIIRIETDQGADIGTLVSQYIMVMQELRNRSR